MHDCMIDDARNVRLEGICYDHVNGRVRNDMLFFEDAKFSSIADLMGDRYLFIITMDNKYKSSHLHVARITIIFLVTIKTRQPDRDRTRLEGSGEGRKRERMEVHAHRTEMMKIQQRYHQRERAPKPGISAVDVQYKDTTAQKLQITRRSPRQLIQVMPGADALYSYQRGGRAESSAGY